MKQLHWCTLYAVRCTVHTSGRYLLPDICLYVQTYFYNINTEILLKICFKTFIVAHLLYAEYKATISLWFTCFDSSKHLNVCFNHFKIFLFLKGFFSESCASAQGNHVCFPKRSHCVTLKKHISSHPSVHSTVYTMHRAILLVENAVMLPNCNYVLACTDILYGWC